MCYSFYHKFSFLRMWEEKEPVLFRLNSNNLAAVAAVKIKFVKKHEKRKRDKGAEESAYF